jgi:hypothetical protein
MNTTTLELGQIVATAGVDAWFTPERRVAVAECLSRHHRGDWGEVCQEDAALNDAAVEQECRVLSAYTVDDARLWIITEWDRSVTTLLLPSEY